MPDEFFSMYRMYFRIFRLFIRRLRNILDIVAWRLVKVEIGGKRFLDFEVPGMGEGGQGGGVGGALIDLLEVRVESCRRLFVVSKLECLGRRDDFFLGFLGEGGLLGPWGFAAWGSGRGEKSIDFAV
jgi:hypothetical protein